jgi:hypothetical protein
MPPARRLLHTDSTRLAVLSEVLCAVKELGDDRENAPPTDDDDGDPPRDDTVWLILPVNVPRPVPPVPHIISRDNIPRQPHAYPCRVSRVFEV